MGEVGERSDFFGTVDSVFREITKDERKSRIKKCRRQRRPSKPQTPAVRTFFRYTVSGSNPESKSASGVRVPASAGGCKVPPGVIAKILVSRMTSIAFVARLGQLPLPSPSAAGKAHTPFEARYPTQNLRRIKQRRSVFWLSHLHHPTAPNEGEIYQQYEGNKV